MTRLKTLFFLIITFTYIRNSEIPVFRVPKFYICKLDSYCADPNYGYEGNNYLTSLMANLYGRLIYYNTEDKIVPMIASNFYVKNKKIIFQFDNRILTNKNIRVSSDDVEKSFHRAMYLMNSKILNISTYICPEFIKDKVKLKCIGLINYQNQIIIKPIKEQYIPIIINLLTKSYYSIFPKDSISGIEDGFSYISPRHTTGAYYLYGDSFDGNWRLHKNFNFPFSNSRSPEIVQFNGDVSKTDFELFKLNMTDIIPASYRYLSSREYDYINSINANVSMGVYNRKVLLCFSHQFMSQSKIEERLALGAIFKFEYLKSGQVFGAQGAEQYFSLLSNSSLNKTNLNQIRNLYGRKYELNKNKIYNLHSRNRQFVQRKSMFSKYKQIKILNANDVAFETPIEQRGDFYNGVIYSDIYNPLFEIAALIETSCVRNQNLNLENMVSIYLNLKTSKDKNEFLKKVHYQLLKNVLIYPVVNLPQITVTGANWKFKESNLHDEMPIWEIEYQNENL